jgi:hypothetical protein
MPTPKELARLRDFEKNKWFVVNEAVDVESSSDEEEGVAKHSAGQGNIFNTRYIKRRSEDEEHDDSDEEDKDDDGDGDARRRNKSSSSSAAAAAAASPASQSSQDDLYKLAGGMGGGGKVTMIDGRMIQPKSTHSTTLKGKEEVDDGNENEAIDLAHFDVRVNGEVEREGEASVEYGVD